MTTHWGWPWTRSLGWVGGVSRGGRKSGRGVVQGRYRGKACCKAGEALLYSPGRPPKLQRCPQCAPHPLSPPLRPAPPPRPQAKEFTDSGTVLAGAAARAVAQAALARGSPDNVTAAVMLFDWHSALSG
jgi:hypothetical protein